MLNVSGLCRLSLGFQDVGLAELFPGRRDWRETFLSEVVVGNFLIRLYLLIVEQRNSIGSVIVVGQLIFGTIGVTT